MSNMNNMSKINQVELRKVPIMGTMHTINVIVTTEDNKEPQKIFSYYPDEISFTEEEIIGLTIEEANQLRHDKDVAYLRS